MESYISISFLNDFIFCPRSIYFHQIYAGYDTRVYQQKPQIAGKAAHLSIDHKTYSSDSLVLTGIEVYSEKYRLHGKIDVFNSASGILTERKREIKTIYDGYIFQVYAHYWCLTEMGYPVKAIRIHDLIHNKNYPVKLPTDDPQMQANFEKLIEKINSFDMLEESFKPLEAKCRKCIYSNLCDFSLC